MRHFIIPIFVPFLGCPHQCIFCDQKKITGVPSPIVTPGQVEKTVKQYIITRGRKQLSTTQVAFYGGTFTGLDLDTQKSLLSVVHKFIADGEVDAIRISTRPDYIAPDTLQFLKDYEVDTIELGVQSMVDRVLALSGRGHTACDVEKAVKAIKEHKLKVGLQIMPGLPGDTPRLADNTVDRVIKMKPDFVRIYPTLVIKDTLLEKLYSRGKFSPMTLSEAVKFCAKALLKFGAADIPVVRVGLQPTPELERKGTIVAGPYHPAFRQLAESAIFFRMATMLIEQMPIHNGRPKFRVNGKDYSYFCGQKNENIARLKEMYQLEDVEIVAETGVKKDAVELVVGSSIALIERKDLGLAFQPAPERHERKQAGRYR